MKSKLIIDELLRLENEKRSSLENELSRLPKSNLYIRRRKNGVHFAEYSNGRQITLDSKDNRIYEIARAQYIKTLIGNSGKVCGVLQHTKDKLKSVENNSINNLLDKYSVLDLQRIRMSEKEIEWCRNYESNSYRPEALKYVTVNGVKVRSKSERAIGNRLEEYNIPYRYEPKVVIDGKVYYPDFMILCPEGDVIIWEHLGLMDDENYRMKAFVKINAYRKMGYVQHRNLVCTWEEDVEDTAAIDEIISKFILKIPV